jgi:hypothetical protein
MNPAVVIRRAVTRTGLGVKRSTMRDAPAEAAIRVRLKGKYDTPVSSSISTAAIANPAIVLPEPQPQLINGLFVLDGPFEPREQYERKRDAGGAGRMGEWWGRHQQVS